MQDITRGAYGGRFPTRVELPRNGTLLNEFSFQEWGCVKIQRKAIAILAVVVQGMTGCLCDQSAHAKTSLIDPSNLSTAA